MRRRAENMEFRIFRLDDALFIREEFLYERRDCRRP